MIGIESCITDGLSGEDGIEFYHHTAASMLHAAIHLAETRDNWRSAMFIQYIVYIVRALLNCSVIGLIVPQDLLGPYINACIETLTVPDTAVPCKI